MSNKDIDDYEENSPAVEFKILDEVQVEKMRVKEEDSSWSYALLRRKKDGRVFLVELHQIEGKVGWCYADTDFVDKEAHMEFIKDEPEEYKKRNPWECYRSEVLEDFVKKTETRK